MNSSPKRRRLHLPSLAPHRNADDRTASSTDRPCYNNDNNNDNNNDDDNNIHSRKSDRVLRYGETVDSFFCLDLLDTAVISNNNDNGNNNNNNNNNDGEEDGSYSRHRRLCQSIVRSQADDARVWIEALSYTHRHYHRRHHDNNDVNSTSEAGRRLIALHRRAASRFKHNDGETISSSGSTSTTTDHRRHDDILKLWLYYAATLLFYDNDQSTTSSTAALDTYRHVQRMFYNDESSEFYTALFDAKELNREVLTKVRKQAVWSSAVVGSGVNGLVERQWRALEQGGMLHHGRPTDVASGKKKLALPSLAGKSVVARGTASKSGDDADGVVDESGSIRNDAELVSVSDSRIKRAEQCETSVAMSKTTTTPTFDRDSLKRDTPKSILSAATKRQSSSVADPTENSIDKITKRVTIQSGTSKRIISKTDDTTASADDNNVSSYRAKMEARKRARAARGSKLKRKEVSISAILSRTLDGDDGSDDEDADNLPYVPKQNTDADSQYTPPETKDIEDNDWPPQGNNTTTFQSSHAPNSDQARKHFKENISPIEELEGMTSTASVRDMDLDYLLNWDPSKREIDANTKRQAASKNGKEHVKKGMAASAAPKITRNDLGYMMNWEPFPKSRGEDDSNSQDGEDDDKTTKSKSRGANNNNMMSRIDEEEDATDDASAVHSSAVTANSGSTSCSQDSASAAQQQKRTSMDTHASSKSYGARDKPDKTVSANNHSLPNVEQSFLPLIETNNVINVDNQPYAKLGVIGKGGSCKVYRALSRDCDVVALKKVKLDGLNKQAIDGYANEIALLKRLKGNPAIIQLYSSEVDLERKSIFLVMELGEVDLNYVLRQQELLSSKQGRGSGRSNLNMNFIRLTWQQMLTAVHSIHEERIVHSDLKPANFLFVRGALKLIDFGIAKAIESQDTTNVYRETLSGTLSYMSPEAIMGTSTNSNGVKVNKCGRASDIWSLGCILYQMVYGKTPFAECHGIPQKVLAITNPNHVINFPNDVDEAAIDAMKLCLERNPKLRGTIVGKNGLLNEHIFLHSRTKR